MDLTKSKLHMSTYIFYIWKLMIHVFSFLSVSLFSKSVVIISAFFHIFLSKLFLSVFILTFFLISASSWKYFHANILSISCSVFLFICFYLHALPQLKHFVRLDLVCTFDGNITFNQTQFV